jgi:hypothetical protein
MPRNGRHREYACKIALFSKLDSVKKTKRKWPAKKLNGKNRKVKNICAKTNISGKILKRLLCLHVLLHV